jgi:hypothetical protein
VGTGFAARLRIGEAAGMGYETGFPEEDEETDAGADFGMSDEDFGFPDDESLFLDDENGDESENTDE